METVIQVLEKMGRATYREVAARLKIDPVEALNMLREHKQQGLCDFFDGAWSVGTEKEQARELAKASAVAPVHQAPRLKGEEPAPVDAEAIRQLLDKNGAMTTAALAAAVNRNARGMVSVMLAFERQGVVVKNGQGKGVTWSLPVDDEPAEHGPEPEAAAEAEKVKSVEMIIGEIPSFTEGYNAGQYVPTVSVISREIRRTKNKLVKLEELRKAMRVIGRNKLLVQQLTGRE